MKKIAWMLTILIVLGVALSWAQPRVSAGIFANGSNTLSVKAKVYNLGITSTLWSNVIVTVYWPTASGISLGSISSAYGITTQGGIGTDGLNSYQKFGSTPNTTITWALNSENELFTVGVTGSGLTTFTLKNPPGGSGDWYFETGSGDYTNYSLLFYQESTDLPLPVTLTSFTGSANASKGGVVLEWKTASEVNNYGYTVQRKADG